MSQSKVVLKTLQVCMQAACTDNIADGSVNGCAILAYKS